MAQYTFSENKTGYKVLDGHHQFDIYEGWIGQSTVQTKDPVWAAPEGPESTPCAKHFEGVAINYHLDDSFDDSWRVFETMAEAEAAMRQYVEDLNEDA